jgi:hypothetical protein
LASEVKRTESQSEEGGYPHHPYQLLLNEVQLNEREEKPSRG